MGEEEGSLELSEYSDNYAKSPRFFRIVKLHLAAIVLNRAPYTFHTETMTGGILLLRGKLPECICGFYAQEFSTERAA